MTYQKQIFLKPVFNYCFHIISLIKFHIMLQQMLKTSIASEPDDCFTFADEFILLKV